MPPLATEERPKAESIVILAGMVLGGIERRPNTTSLGGHRQNVESRKLLPDNDRRLGTGGTRGEQRHAPHEAPVFIFSHKKGMYMAMVWSFVQSFRWLDCNFDPRNT